MIEKRSFMYGFILGILAGAEVPKEQWKARVNKHAKEFNMSVLEPKERKEIADFLEYVATMPKRANYADFI